MEGGGKSIERCKYCIVGRFDMVGKIHMGRESCIAILLAVID